MAEMISAPESLPEPPRHTVDLISTPHPSIQKASTLQRPDPAHLQRKSLSKARPGDSLQWQSKKLFTTGEHEVAAQLNSQEAPNPSPSRDLHGWSKATQAMNQLSLAQIGTLAPLIDRLLKRLDHTLIYPPDLARARISGRVLIAIEIDPRLRLRRVVDFDGGNSALTLFCLLHLRSSLAALDDTDPKAPRQDTLIVQVEYDFRLLLDGAPPRELVSSASKAKVHLVRQGEAKSQFREALDEFFEHTIPPILPFPGGVYVDFVGLYKWTRNWLEDLPQESDLRRERIQQIEQLTRKAIEQSSRPKGPRDLSPDPKQ